MCLSMHIHVPIVPSQLSLSGPVFLIDDSKGAPAYLPCKGLRLKLDHSLPLAKPWCGKCFTLGILGGATGGLSDQKAERKQIAYEQIQ